MSRSLVLTAFLCTLLAVPAPGSVLAQEQGEGGDEIEVLPGVSRPAAPTMRAHRVREAIDVDGRLDEEVWRESPSFRGFIQREPVEGAPARNDSEVWVLYDDEALYIGAVLHDEDPASIARSLSRRNATYSGQFDYFEVMLDPNRDRRTGYRFRVTAANVQTDRYLYDDDGQDAAWDAVWESEVRIHDGGWTVEMRIPFSQIRYEATPGEQAWGINFGRRRAADNELTGFALESRLVQGRVSQFGRLEGVEVSRSPRRVEVRPYVVTRARTAPAEEGDPFFDGREAAVETGMELRYGLGTSFTLDATVNPDFGQVEADPAVINLTASETFFREQRPFFVEDARVFDFSLSGGRNQLFYSRRIGRTPRADGPGGADFTEVSGTSRILGAAKLTGRTPGGLSVGALGAVTGEERGTAYFREEDRFQDFTAEPRTGYGVVRLQQDFREGGSRVGGIVTATQGALPPDGELDFLPARAFSGGLDFEHTWADREWAFSGFVAGTHVRGDSAAVDRIQRSNNHYRQRPDLEWGSYAPGATALTGGEWRLELDRRRGQWTGSLWTGQVLPGYAANDLGFNTNSERLTGGLRVNFQEVAPGTWYREYTLRLFAFQDWSHELLAGSPWSWDRWSWAQTRGMASLSGDVTLLNFWELDSRIRYSPRTMSRRATRGGPRMVDPGSLSWSVGLSTDNRARVSFSPQLELSRDRLDSGGEASVSVRTRIQPSSRLEVEVEPGYARSRDAAQYVTSTGALPHEPTFGDRYVFADLERHDFSMETRVNWTFTPRLSLQLFSQPLLSSGDFTRHKQLARSESFEFEVFDEGTFRSMEGRAHCLDGRTCLDPGGIRWIDLDGDGEADVSFQDRDFNVRSLRSTAVLRWEYRPGSTLFFVWQRRQSQTASVGDFDIRRDARALLDVPSDDVFILKANLWLTL